MIVGAILTQRTAWRNAEQAVDSLRERGLLSARAVLEVSVEALEEAIRAAGFCRAKARALKGFAAFLNERHDGDLGRLLRVPVEALRDTLLRLPGIGEETADAILVYAAQVPSFVVDAYARRLLVRLGWIEGGEPYAVLRDLFLGALPRDARVLGEFHALIVRHGKAHCRARPACDACPLRAICPAGSPTGKLEGAR